MLSNKIITSGVVVVIILAAVYIGNLVMRTTPSSSALGNQYKVVGVVASGCREATCIEKLLNDTAKDGWELAATDNEFFVFRK